MVACAVSAALGFGAAVLSRPWSAGAAASDGKPDQSTIVDVRTTRRLVALTFDDGPDPRWTPQVLELLHRHGATATFFDTGLNAMARPDLVAAEIGAGNGVGDHTWSHPHLTHLGASAIDAEIVRGAQAIQRAGAPEPRLFRPPFGASNETVAVVADAEGYRTVLWSVALEHFLSRTSDTNAAVAAVLDRVQPGSIILAHDGGVPDRTRTLQALPMLLEGLETRGYRVVDVEALLAAARYPPPHGPRRSGSPDTLRG